MSEHEGGWIISR